MSIEEQLYEDGLVDAWDMEEYKAKNQNEYDHAVLFDVHTWSDYPEANSFVDALYDMCFVGDGGNQRIAKKHLKVLLLDLYVTWKADPSLYTVFSRDNAYYLRGSRYNELNISRKSITVVDRLIEHGLLTHKEGIRFPGYARASRIRPTERLIAMFEAVAFDENHVQWNNEDRETVILKSVKDEQGKTSRVEYKDTEETIQIRNMLAAYNELLQSVDISIGGLTKEAYITTNIRGCERVLLKDKFVKRVFNRGSWDRGGRFAGGFWQRCPSEWRNHILINGKPCQEIDFTGFNPTLVYALEGIEYWENFDIEPYTIPLVEGFEGCGQRQILKKLTLNLLNADSVEGAFGAFRSAYPAGHPYKRMDNDILSRLPDAYAEHHPLVAGLFGQDTGVRLMYAESQIAASIIQHFMDKGVPALCIHDSFIVPQGYEDELDATMRLSFEQVTGVPLRHPRAVKHEQIRIADLEMDLNAWMPNVPYFQELEESYLTRLNPNTYTPNIFQ